MKNDLLNTDSLIKQAELVIDRLKQDDAQRKAKSIEVAGISDYVIIPGFGKVATKRKFEKEKKKTNKVVIKPKKIKVTLPFYMSKSTKVWNKLSSEEKAMRRRLMALSGDTINKSEQALKEILMELFPEEWEFTGLGNLIINRKCPDFVNRNRSLIIELFGEYWHRGDNENERVDEFKEAGYDTLIIWSAELRDKERLKDKLRAFVYANTPQTTSMAINVDK